jgi:hypothetical protein
MPKIVDRTGEKHGRLLVLGLAGFRGKEKLCRVRCDCGVEKDVVQSKLVTKTKPVKSCGCLAKDNHYRTHEKTTHKFYSIWNTMIGRCYRESQKSYKDYGGRGITVCDEWKDRPDAFFAWLENNGHVKGYQLDRIDNDGNYSPDNCRIITPKENSNDKRNTVKYNVGGEHLTIAQMADNSGIKYATLYKRIKLMGMPAAEALSMKSWQRVRPVGG